ncbi:hypothetical protein V5O48_018396, partial [Marasmius crinis-equi]
VPKAVRRRGARPSTRGSRPPKPVILVPVKPRAGRDALSKPKPSTRGPKPVKPATLTSIVRRGSKKHPIGKRRVQRSVAYLDSDEGSDDDKIPTTIDHSQPAAIVTHGVSFITRSLDASNARNNIHISTHLWVVHDFNQRSYTFRPWAHDESTMKQIITVFAACNYINRNVIKTPAFWEIAGDVESSHYTALGPLKGPALCQGTPQAHHALRIMAHDKYLRTSRAELQDIFAGHHILVEGQPVPTEDQKWCPQVISRIGNMHVQREIHDLSLRADVLHANDQICEGTLHDVHWEGAHLFGKQLNCLDTPGPPVGDALYPSRLQLDARASQGLTPEDTKYLGSQRYPSESTYWHLLATQYCTHPCHIDTSGFATSVSVQVGLKLFVLLVPGESLPSFAESNGSLSFPQFDDDMSNKVGMIPVPVLLGPGDTLIMRPCTPHWVYTLESSLCHGSHFFAGSTMTDTCFGLLHTFTSGFYITNQPDISHRLTLARIMCFWADALIDSGFFDCSKPPLVEDLPDLWSISGVIDFLSLYNVIYLGSLLWPERYRKESLDEESLKAYEEGLKAYDRARARADALFDWVDARIRVVLGPSPSHSYDNANPAYDNGDGEEDYFHHGSIGRLRRIREDYLVHQCVALCRALQMKPRDATESCVRTLTFSRCLFQDLKGSFPEVYARVKGITAKGVATGLPLQEYVTYAWVDRHLQDNRQYGIATRYLTLFEGARDARRNPRLATKELPLCDHERLWRSVEGVKAGPREGDGGCAVSSFCSTGLGTVVLPHAPHVHPRDAGGNRARPIGGGLYLQRIARDSSTVVPENMVGSGMGSGVVPGPVDDRGDVVGEGGERVLAHSPHTEVQGLSALSALTSLYESDSDCEMVPSALTSLDESQPIDVMSINGGENAQGGAHPMAPRGTKRRRSLSNGAGPSTKFRRASGSPARVPKVKPSSSLSSETAPASHLPEYSYYLDPRPDYSDLPEAGSGQRYGECWQDFFKRREEEHARNPLSRGEERSVRGRSASARRMKCPQPEGADLWYWALRRPRGKAPVFIRCKIPGPSKHVVWDYVSSTQRRFDPRENCWDLCTDFGPPELPSESEDDGEDVEDEGAEQDAKAEQDAGSLPSRSVPDIPS